VALPVQPGHRGTLGIPGRPDRRVKQGPPAPRGRRDPPGRQVPLVKRETPDLPALRVPLEPRVKPVIKEALDLLVILESRDRRARQDRKEIRAMWVKLGQQGLMVQQDLQVLRDILDRRGMTVPRALRGATEKRVKRDRRERRDPPAIPGQ